MTHNNINNYINYNIKSINNNEYIFNINIINELLNTYKIQQIMLTDLNKNQLAHVSVACRIGKKNINKTCFKKMQKKNQYNIPFTYISLQKKTQITIILYLVLESLNEHIYDQELIEQILLNI